MYNTKTAEQESLRHVECEKSVESVNFLVFMK